MNRMIEWLKPDWPVPAHVRAASTTRRGGVSEGPWAGLNLASHVGDDPASVEANRRRMARQLSLPGPPAWLVQVHGDKVCELPLSGTDCEADAATSNQPGQVCVVLTADCLPVLLADHAGSRVAAVHAGWRGLAGGALDAGVGAFDRPDKVMAWLGPAIGPAAFEVGDEVREAFIQVDGENQQGFKPARPGHWLADLYLLARLRLAALGVPEVFGGDFCTFSDAERFYSFRRDRITGRMASLIWIEP